MNWIWNLFGKGSFIAIFILIGLEYSCFPIPSEIVLPLAGFATRINGYNLFGTILFSILVSYFGCLVCYLIGYYGGAGLFNKIYNKMKKWRKGLDKAKEMFNKYGNVSVLAGRLVPLCRTYISFFAGMFNQSLLKYSFYSILGIGVWNTILIVLGYELMNKKDLITNYYNNYKTILIIVFSLLFLMFIVSKLYKKMKSAKNINGD